MPCQQQVLLRHSRDNTYTAASISVNACVKRDHNRGFAYAWACSTFSIQYLRHRKMENRTTSDLSYSRRPGASRFASRYDRAREETSAENFVEIAYVTGSTCASLARGVCDFSQEDEPRLSLDDIALRMTARGFQSLALIQLYGRKFLNKSLLTGSRDEGTRKGRIWRFSSATWNSCLSYTEGRDVREKVENSGLARKREWRWLGRQAFNGITCHFGSSWYTWRRAFRRNFRRGRVKSCEQLNRGAMERWYNKVFLKQASMIKLFYFEEFFMTQNFAKNKS